MSSSTDRIRVGLIGKPYGLGGHVTVRVETDDEDRFSIGATFPGPDGGTLVVDDVRDADRGILLRFEEHHTRERGEALRGHALTIDPSERRRLGDDEFWPDELVGMRVVDTAEEQVGVVTGVVEGHAQDRLLVRTEAGLDVEIPFVRAFVTEVDMENRVVEVDPIPGLIDG